MLFSAILRILSMNNIFYIFGVQNCKNYKIQSVLDCLFRVKLQGIANFIHCGAVIKPCQVGQAMRQ